ncbi:ubiquitin thioesterase otubain-like [Chironomus tepperi]|uniref:ubiquitin thioesterase otubain-like n=1 Tax=Chironomus tepperi TaxID=113505 RepID=UPI00391F5090
MEQSSDNHDELTIKQQKEIEKEINEQFALISEKIPIEILNDEYADDPVYRQKVQDISSKYRYMRKIRPDGNCFYRAFGFTTLEHLIKNKEEFKKFRQVIEQSKAKLIQLNFPQFTIDDFYDTIMEVINKVEPSDNQDVDKVLDELYKLFNEQAYSDYIVVYLRLITSGKLQEEAEFYSNFIEGNYTSLLDFCKKEVEPMYKESDHIHIIAICAALGCAVRVVYMDRGSQSEVIAHDFPDCPDKYPSVFLLYRPNHYDVLYQ